MLVTSQGHRGYRFGEFLLDLDRRALLRDGEEVPLRPKAVDLLEFLLQHAGILVSRQQMLDAVWPDAVVTDDSISQCLYDIRRALGDELREQVRTVPRKGVIFDAAVTQVPERRAVLDRPPGKATATIPPAAAGWAAFAVVIALLLATGPWWPGMDTRPMATPGAFDPPQHSIAVLAFDDLSPEADSDWFAMGVSEEVLNLLAQSPELTVIARTSSFAFSGSDATVPEIAQRLNVAHVLEGSVRRDGDRVRVTAQLADARTDAHLWSQTYDGTLDDVFGVQEDIARSVTDVLHVELLGEHPSALAHQPDPEAWSLYQRANYLYQRRAPGDLEQSVELYREATTIDPDYAQAWAGLSGALTLTVLAGPRPLDEVLALAERAALRAVRLAPDDPVVLLRAARVHRLAGRIDEAWALCERAQRMDPDHPLVLGAMTWWHMVHDHDYERIAELDGQAARLDPMNPVTQFNYGHSLLSLGQFGAAEARFRYAKELSPQAPDFDYNIALAVLLQGRASEALQAAGTVPEASHRLKLKAMAHHALGNASESEAALQQLQRFPGAETAVDVAEVHAYRGEPRAAQTWLDTARDRVDVRDAAAVDRLLIASQGAILRLHREDPALNASMDTLRRDMAAHSRSGETLAHDA